MGSKHPNLTIHPEEDDAALKNANQNSINVNSSNNAIQDDRPPANVKNQLVLYDPTAVTAGPILPLSDQVESLTPPTRRSPFMQTSRTLPSTAAYTVQCARCFKWRIVPKEEKYEEIRAQIFERLFYCVRAREWDREVSCDDPTDVSQDESRTWAIDIPGIVQPPCGWRRHVRIRAEGGTKFADVYYEAPSGKKFRSLVEVEKYLQENPGYVKEGVRISQFSFQIPKPLKENYVKKRTARAAPPRDRSGSGSREAVEVNPISWIGPDGKRNLNLGGPSPNADVVPSKPSNESKRRRIES